MHLKSHHPWLPQSPYIKLCRRSHCQRLSSWKASSQRNQHMSQHSQRRRTWRWSSQPMIWTLCIKSFRRWHRVSNPFHSPKLECESQTCTHLNHPFYPIMLQALYTDHVSFLAQLLIQWFPKTHSLKPWPPHPLQSHLTTRHLYPNHFPISPMHH